MQTSYGRMQRDQKLLTLVVPLSYRLRNLKKKILSPTINQQSYQKQSGLFVAPVRSEERTVIGKVSGLNSFSTYRTGFIQFLIFCYRFAIPPFPLAENVLENFYVDICHRVSHKSIKVYLSSIQFFSNKQELSRTCEDLQFIDRE